MNVEKSDSGKRAVLMYDGSPDSFAGAEMFFINAAEQLVRAGFGVMLVDLPDSIIPRYLRERGVEFDFVPFAKKKRLRIGKRCDFLMVTNTKTFHCCRLDLNRDCKVLVVEIDKDFWDDRNRGPGLWARLSNFTFRRWKQYLVDRRGVAVLERSAIEYAAKCGYRGAEAMKVVPLMVPDVPEDAVKKDVAAGARMRVVGVARATPYKIAPLAHWFPRIKRIFPEASFTFVTHNPEAAREIFAKFGVDFVRFEPGKSPEELNRFLLGNADLAIAMGTTALNCAVLGIPTLVADASHEWPYPAELVRWVHDCGENLGEYVTAASRPQYGIAIEEALKQFSDTRGVVVGGDIGALCREHVVSRHSPKAFREALVAAMSASRVTFGEYAMRTRWGVLR